MLKSMTGYGKATAAYLGKRVSVEVKSLNSKSLDLNVRYAPIYKELEPARIKWYDFLPVYFPFIQIVKAFKK